MAKASTRDVEVIVDEGDVVELTTGFKVRVLPLKSRQFFKLLRIITHGAGGLLMNLNFSSEDTEEQFGAKLLALVGYAIPDAEDEVIEFLLSITEADGTKAGRRLSKEEKATNAELHENLLDELDNPELGDLVTLVEAIVTREASDLQALGKRLKQMFDLAKKTGQIPQTVELPDSSK
jgi:hypothetical protein